MRQRHTEPTAGTLTTVAAAIVAALMLSTIAPTAASPAAPAPNDDTATETARPAETTAPTVASGPASSTAAAPAERDEATAYTEATGPTEAAPRWLQVDAGLLHTCAVRVDHRLFCWGLDDAGQLGDGLPRKNRKWPVEVAGRTADWAVVSAGDVHTCAIKTTGRLFCWGSGFLGRLGTGNTQDRAAPVQVAGLTTDWASISVGGSTTCGTRTSGRLFCWGGDRRGTNGDGGGADGVTTVPTEVAGNATDWQSVTAGFNHACGRKTSGRILCWGDDTFGKVGNGPPTDGIHTTPVPLTGDPTDWASVTTSNQHTCATKTTGRLFCWGNGTDWALGSPGQDWVHYSSPNEVVGSSTNWATVATGYRHTCGRRTAGRLYCWGSPNRAALGQNRQFIQATPLLVPGGFTDWTTVTAGMWSTCALRANGLLYCWGRNDYGQAGVGSTAPKIVGPRRVGA